MKPVHCNDNLLHQMKITSKPRRASKYSNDKQIEPQISNSEINSLIKNLSNHNAATTVRFRNDWIFFEYLDHSADILIHSWGSSLPKTFANAALGLFNYMSDLSFINAKEQRVIKAVGHDIKSLLYNFLNEMLFIYGSSYFIGCEIIIHTFEDDLVVATVLGECFDRLIHAVGTEIKAITMHEMQIFSSQSNLCEAIILVDI